MQYQSCVTHAHSPLERCELHGFYSATRMHSEVYAVVYSVCPSVILISNRAHYQAIST